MTAVSIVVPFNPDQAHRDRAWRYLLSRYRLLHPDWEIVEGRDHGDRWSKGRAVADGAARANGEILVVADADSWVSADTLNRAVAVAAGEAWVVPHERVHRLSYVRSEAVITHGPIDTLNVGRAVLDRRPYIGPPGGGIVVLSRATYDLVGGPDPRFEGWGGEDISWGAALDTIAGRHVRLDGDLWHLWHPPQPNWRRGHAESNELAERYKEARGNPRLMAALLEQRSPDPKVMLDKPVTFRCDRPVLNVRVAGQTIRFRSGRHATCDPDIAAGLRVNPRFEEVA